jgi:16S rRNA (adenine1518-N6/adenine1519-N6)-dimethyltransferase
VQREVADRILSPAGRKCYGLLSIIFQASGRVRRIRNIPPLAFWPAPKIDSTMLSWVRATEGTGQGPDSRKGIGATAPLSTEDLLTVREVAKVLLHYRRKKISSCIALKQDSPLTITDLNRALASTGIDPNLRAEQLSVQQYIALARTINAL